MKEILKWLSALGLSGLLVALQAIAAQLGAGPSGVDPLVALVIVAGLKRLIDYLVSKLPVQA